MKFRTALIVISGLGLGACTTPGKRTAMGAGTGAAVGGVAGAVAGGGKGALIGAGVGAVAGGAVGNYLDKQANELKKVTNTKRTENGVLVNLSNDILFDTGSAILKPDALTELNRVGDILSKYPEDRIKIEGHTDNVGAAMMNEQLSLRRAETVKNVLTSRGVNEKQILVLGVGKSRPVADNSTEDGRARNRRVELHIDVPPEKVANSQKRG